MSLPLVGSVVLSGLTLQQASGLIQELLSSQLLRPEAQLTVVTPRPILLRCGAVEKPGVYCSQQLRAEKEEVKVVLDRHNQDFLRWLMRPKGRWHQQQADRDQ